MNIELITKADFHSFKNEIVEEIKKLVQPQTDQSEWLKSADVTEMLGCSPGTLQNLRVSGKLPFTKIGGTIYYSRKDVLNVLEANKRNAA